MTPDPVTRAMRDIVRDFGLVRVIVSVNEDVAEARAYLPDGFVYSVAAHRDVPTVLAALRTELQGEREDRG